MRHRHGVMGEVLNARLRADRPRAPLGGEVLVSRMAAAQHGYLYKGGDERHPGDVEDPALQRAVQTARQHIRVPGQVGTFAPLRT